MRIVHVTPNYYPTIGGGQTHMREISERLARRGHEVTVFTRNVFRGQGSSSDLLPDSEVVNNVTVRRFNSLTPEQKLSRVRGSGLLLRTANSDYLNMWMKGPIMPRIITATIRCDPDIVTTLNWGLAALPYQIRLAKILKRFSFVAVPLFHTEEKWVYQTIYPPMLAHCDAVLVNTEHEGRFVRTLSPGIRDVHVVGVGVTPDAFASPHGDKVRARYGLGNLPVVGYVGRRVPQKGVATLGQAMKIVWRSNDQVRLVMAGPLGETEGKRRWERRLLGLSDTDRSRVVEIDSFTDDDKPSIFDALDIFAMPSTGESFGIAYLEAWMCKKPVIGARIGATQCVVSEGVDGLLIDPNDPAALATAILELIRDPDKRKRMGRAGHQKTLARYTWETITDKVESVYSQILSVRKGNRKRNQQKNWVAPPNQAENGSTGVRSRGPA